MIRQPLILFFISIIIGQSLAEGTKELRPAAGDHGSLLLSSSSGYTPFGLYGSGEAYQIKIKITSITETIYYGFNNRNGYEVIGNQISSTDNGSFIPNVPFRILSPSGQVVYSSVMPGAGAQGNIATWNQAAAGPGQLGNAGGYNALTLNPTEVGDYIIEFDLLSPNIANSFIINGYTVPPRMAIPLFDVTVADSNNEPVLGRLYSQGWQISTNAYTNPFRGKVYPLDDGEAVYEVDFNGMQPFVFVINFNSKGAGNTNNHEVDRASKIGNYTYGEYDVFLNPPDPVLFPTDPKLLSLEGNVVKNDCVTADFCLDFTSNSEGDLSGFLDFNNNEIFEPHLGEIYFEDRFEGPGTKCIAWNGRDANGVLVTGDFEVIASLKFGVTHLPMYDVEHNVNGYKISLVRPAGTPPVIFWDDSQIIEGSALDGKINFNGCVSTVSGCHKWEDRGSFIDFDQTKQETINTWWYSTIATTQVLVHIPQVHQVQLSFDPVDLVNSDTTICRGDSLEFYVYNNGKHYDLSKYIYEWGFNTETMAPNVREHKRQIMDESYVVIKAIDRTAATCVSFDTLFIHVVDPVTLIGTVTPPACNTSTGTIEVQLLTGPPNKAFFWDQFPGLNSGILSNVPAGQYNLVAMDPDYPHCGADTSFVLTEADGIAIDTIVFTETSCEESTASAEVFMENPVKQYEYSWNRAAYSSNSTISGLGTGSHTIRVREIESNCIDTRTFVIPASQIQYSVVSINEYCNNDNGRISIILPTLVSDYNITWNGIAEQVTEKTNLSAGNFHIHIHPVSHPSCAFDTTVIITNEDYKLQISSLSVVGSDCQNPQGEALLTMELAGNYSYSWNNAAPVSVNSISNLPVGTHSVSVTDGSNGCSLDTTFIIEALNYPATVISENEICNSKTGSINVNPANTTNTEIIWADGHSATFFREGLSSGTYSFELRQVNFPACKITKTVTIEDSTYSLYTDFDYTVAKADSMNKAVLLFTNLSQNYIWSNWSFGEGTTSTDNHPRHAFNKEEEFNIHLTVIDSNGCWGEAEKRVSTIDLIDTEIPCTLINLPNVFSPNNDGYNDDIGILGYAPTVELRIFNRWGEVIFRTFDIKYRWDGNYRGDEAPVGVYPYILDWECIDPTTGGVIRNHKVGDITLVR